MVATSAVAPTAAVMVAAAEGGGGEAGTGPRRRARGARLFMLFMQLARLTLVYAISSPDTGLPL